MGSAEWTEVSQFTVRHYVDEWKEFLNIKTAAPVELPRRWEKRPNNMIKINIKAAFSERTGAEGWGLICRDSEMDICFAATGAQQALSEPCMPKLLLSFRRFHWQSGWE